MKQVPMILSVGSSPANPPAIVTALPFRADVQTTEGVWHLSISFEGAKDLRRELDLYLQQYETGR